MTYPNDFFEIDFLDVETASSGDAIAIRVGQGGIQTISVVDGGYTDTGEKLVEHINEYYGAPAHIDHVVLTHPDGDHAAGLKTLLENFPVQRLWMNRPWLYADQLIANYPTYNSVDALKGRLKKKYPHVAELETIANEKGVQISEPLQGAQIGHFSVMAPSIELFLQLVLADDDKAEEEAETASSRFDNFLAELAKVAKGMIAAVWGDENLPEKETSPRNEMSVVQFAEIGGKRILLTGDAGARALTEFVEYAPTKGLVLPGINKFQVPHHGSRRNVSSDLLDRILGTKLATQADSVGQFTAIVSAAKMDSHHPKKAVVRAMIHRGGSVISTESGNKCTGWNMPDREGWSAAITLDYPSEQEE